MLNQQLIDYIKKARETGLPDEQIRASLINNGWQPNDVEEGFKSFVSPVSSMPTVSPTEKSYSGDVYGNKPTTIIGGKSSSNKKLIFAVVIILVLLAGGAGAYYFRNNLPFIKNFIAEQSITSTPNNLPASNSALTSSTMPSTVTSSTENPVSTSEKDCGQNLDCFIEASKECSLAKINHSMPLNIFGTEVITSTFMEIRGITDGKCIVYTKTGKTTFNFPPGTSSSTINNSKNMAKKTEGTQTIYKYSKITYLTNMLLDLKQGNFSSKGTCSLTLNGSKCIDGNGTEWETTNP